MADKMITWDEYKKLKRVTEVYLQDGKSNRNDIMIQLLKYKLEQITREEAIEYIIEILSEGRHLNKFKNDRETKS